MASSDETLRILEEEKSVFASEAEKSELRLVELEKSFSDLQSATLTDLQKAAAERESALTDLQNTRDELDKVRSTTVDPPDLKSQLNDVMEVRDTLTQQWQAAEGRLTVATETISALQVRVSSLEQSEGNLTHQLGESKVRSAQLDEALTSLQVRLDEAQAALTQETSSCQVRLAEQEQRVAELKEQSKNQLIKAVEKIKALTASREQQGVHMYVCMYVCMYVFTVR